MVTALWGTSNPLSSGSLVAGFINAAAIIISMSQINKFIGVPIDSGGWLLRDVIGRSPRSPARSRPRYE